MPERFVGEDIEPVVATSDTSRMAAGEPGLPREFVWRGRTVEVVALLRAWHDAQALVRGRNGRRRDDEDLFRTPAATGPEGEQVAALFHQRNGGRGMTMGLPAHGKGRGELMARAVPFLFVLVLLAGSPLRADAADASFYRAAESEYAFLAGYGITHRGFGATHTQVQTADAIFRYGRFLSGDLGEGWYRVRHELLLELPLHVAVDHDDRIMTGGYILGRWSFTAPREYVPYLFAGGGILYVDLGLPTMGSRLDFSYQGGVGLQRFLSRDTALTLEYRYHHVSNADTATPNEPLNSSKILFGISFYR
jgi:lipid A 3-O-deacylase